VHSRPLISTYTKQDMDGMTEIRLLSKNVKEHFIKDLHVLKIGKYYWKGMKIRDSEAGRGSGIPYSE